jgi:hypothetical protein
MQSGNLSVTWERTTLCPSEALTEPSGPGIGGNSVGEDAEHDGANRSRGDNATIGHVGVYHDDAEHNTGQTTGTEPAYKRIGQLK